MNNPMAATRNNDPGKILFNGTLGSGKTTQAEQRARDLRIPYGSIEECRVGMATGQ